MTDLVVSSTGTELEAQEITENLFSQFVQWIDRSQNTTRTYLINLHQFSHYLQERGISRPSRQDVIDYRDYLTQQGYKASTINGYLRACKQFFSWTQQAGLYPDVSQGIHAPKVDRSTHKKDALTAHDVLTIEQSIDNHAAEKVEESESASKDRAGRMQRSTEQGLRLKAIYELVVNAGLRTIEVSRANVKDLEIRGGQAWLYIWGKGRSEADQKQPIAKDVADAIEDYLRARTDHFTGNSPLFVSTGNRSKGKRIASTTISTMLKRAMQDAGYDSERITAHSLRHTAGTLTMEITGDLYQTQQYMRHANPATTEIYLHNESEQQEAQTANKLYDYCHGVQGDSSRDQLEDVLQRLTPEQIGQLTSIASAMAS